MFGEKAGMSRLLNRSCSHALLASAALLCAAPAAAETSALFAPETISGTIDLRVAAANGERGWTEGGFGKARFGGEGDGVHVVPAEATIAWQPPIAWDLGGTIVVAAQHGQDHPVDLVEGFLSYKPLPTGATRFSARAGLFWPAISLEHEGPTWAVADMITPSAINSWIGEEVKVVGLEASATREAGIGRLSATVGLFGFNDTSGTLLAYRGWALHDLKATAFGLEPLPPLNEEIAEGQAARTRPLIEVDGRPGYYAKLAWQLPAPIRLEAFYYANRGDPEAVSERLQWGWETWFFNLGARIDLDSRTRFMAQYLSGETYMGPEDEHDRYWVETRFRSAYARLSHERGPVTISARVDRFRTREEGAYMTATESEHGWAATADVAWRLSPRAELLVELMRIDSVRGVRVRAGIEPEQQQTIGQAAARITL